MVYNNEILAVKLPNFNPKTIITGVEYIGPYIN